MLNILLFFGSYIGGLFAAFRFYPIFAFVVYQAVYFYNPQKRWWGSMVPDISYSYYTVVVMLLLYLVKRKQYNNKLLEIPQLKVAWVLCFLYGLTYFLSPIPELHYDAWVFYVKMLITLTIAFKLCDSIEKFNYILYGYIYGAWYMSFYVYQVGRNSGGRVEGVGMVDSPDANGLAAALAPSIVLSLYFFWVTKSKLVKASFAIAGVFIANAIVLISSRGAFLAVALSVIVFLWIMFTSSFQRKLQKQTAVAILIGGLAGGLYLADASFIERMYTLGEQTEVDSERETGATRMAFWKAAWYMAKDYPFGKGYRGFNKVGYHYIPPNVNTGRSRERTVHSSWFEALSEVGYLGLFLFIMMIFFSFKTTQLCKESLKKRAEVDEYFKVVAIQCSLIAFIVAMTFLNRMRAEILHWCVLFTAIAYQVYVLNYRDKSNVKRY
tara:strand:+ start:1831 stop:3144 length:1314 start_codon:yes stop_codon:yes gene_type:complete